MKVKELVQILNNLNQESEVRLRIEGNALDIGLIGKGKYINTVEIANKLEMSLDEAEQRLYMGSLHGQVNSEEQINAIINRLGKERVDFVSFEIDKFKKNQEQEREENKELIEKIEEVVNSSEVEIEEVKEEKKAKKVTKKAKVKAKDTDEEFLFQFYSGKLEGTAETLSKVKEIRSKLGTEKVNAIFQRAKSNDK